MRCPHCYMTWPAELEGLLKFCGACGRPLEESKPVLPSENLSQIQQANLLVHSSPGGELRFVTVLFADLAGLSALTRESQTEQAGKIESELFQRFGEIVERYGGGVDQFLGDAIIATFGLPRPDPNAARNAVRAGLEMQAEVAETLQKLGLEFGLRIGIHAGEVMFRSVGGSWTVMGDTVNAASRIQRAATPGKVWISRPVYEEVRRFFEMIVRPSVAIQENRQAIQPYEVVSERRVPFYQLPPFVGRELEMKRLHAAREWALQENTLQVLLIRGGTGVGKSRLVLELRDWVQKQERVYRLDVAQYDHSQRLPSHGINSLIRRRFNLPLQLADDELIEALKRKMPLENPGLEPDRQELVVEFFAFAFGVLEPGFRIRNMEGEHQWEGLFVEFKSYLEAQAARRPWIWILEDVQKGDAETAAFLDWATQLTWRQPFLVVMTLREDDFSPDSYWYKPLTNWMADGRLEEIRLREIPPEKLAPSLVDMTNGAISLTSALQIAEHAEGNPLFATELVLLLQDRGMIEKEVGQEQVKLPASVREVMEARLERLGYEGKEVAKRGALMGRRFTRDAVARIWEGSPDELETGLRVLRETETVYPEVSQFFSGEIEEVFRHGRLQEAALARVPREDRLRWLRGLEAWARSRLAGLGSYWENAGVLLIPLIIRSRLEHGDTWEASLWDEVLGLLHRKHNRAREALVALHGALEHASGVRCLVLTVMAAELELVAGLNEEALQTLVETVCARSIAPDTANGSHEAVPEVIQSLRASLLDGSLDWRFVNLQEARLTLRLTEANVLTNLGQAEEARQAYEEVQAGLEAGGNHISPRLWLHWGRLWGHFLTELLVDPQAADQVIRDIYRRLGASVESPELESERLLFLFIEGVVAIRLGRYPLAQQITEARLSLCQMRQNRLEEARAWNTLGIGYQSLGDLAATRKCYKQSLTLSREVGYRRGEGVALHNLSLVYYDQALWDDSLRTQVEYQELSRATGNQMAESYAPAYMAAVYMEKGEFDQAHMLLQEALSIATKKHWPRLVGLCRAYLSQLSFFEWMSGHSVDLLQSTVTGLSETEDEWKWLDEAAEFYSVLALSAHFLGLSSEARAVIARAEEVVDASWLVARKWMDASVAILDNRPAMLLVEWFREAGFERAARFFQRIDRLSRVHITS